MGIPGSSVKNKTSSWEPLMRFIAGLWTRILEVGIRVDFVVLKVVMLVFVRLWGRWKGVSQVKRVIGVVAWERRVRWRVGGIGEEKLWVLGRMERVMSIRGGN